MEGSKIAVETFADRLKDAMSKQGKKQVDLIRIASEYGVKLGKSHVSQYVSGKTVPRADTLHFLADVLQVDENWLKNGTNEQTIPYFTATVNNEAVNEKYLGGNNMREFKKSSNWTMFYMT